MTDETNLNPTPMDQTVPRTPTGEIIDQAAAQTVTTPASETAPTAPTSGAPEAYDFKAPEGVTLDAAVVEKASPIFKELGLSQEQAQKLVDFYSEQSAKTNSDLMKAVDDMRASWRDAITKDPDIGSKLDSVRVELGRAKDRMPPAVRTAFDEAMNTTGLGDHPGIVKGLYELSKLVNEGTHVTGGAPSPLGQNPKGAAPKPTLAGAMYPHLPQ